MSATKTEIANWLIETIRSGGILYQEFAVREIEERFGSEWVYENDNGNPAINRGVLTEFRKLKPGNIEWDSGDKSWSCY